MKHFKSEYFDSVDDLVQAKTDAFANVKERREKLEIIRKFTNMMNVMTEEEAEELGVTEITNHGMTHRAMLQNEAQFASMVSVTNALVEVIVDTDSPEKDLVTGMRISEAINRGAVHFKGKFANFWRKVSGELVIAGGCPVTQNERYGWLPNLRTDMVFPPNTGLDSENVTYAFDPKSLSMADLRRLLAVAKPEGNHYVHHGNIKKLIDVVGEKILRTTTTEFAGDDEENSYSVHASNARERKIEIKAWWYYEVKWDKKGNQYVSATLFTDRIYDGPEALDLTEDRSGRNTAAVVLAYIDKAYESTTDWLQLVSVDSEVGGVKTLDSLKGVAEMSYNSGVDMEELFNLIIEGEKIRARPKMRVLENANADDVQKWDAYRDAFVPAGLEEMKMNSSPNGLHGPLQILSQNSAGLTTTDVSNSERGGELRKQAEERQQNSSMLQTNRLTEASNHLDSILETVVYRLLLAPVKPGTDGYNEIMWVRAYLDRYQIPYKDLAKRKHGRFQYMRVRARRVVGNGDRSQQISTSDWLMANIQNYEPAARPLVLQQATMLRTQDPDLTENLVKVPQPIINAQRITAENEYDTIRRRAVLGQMLPIMPDDIHQDHIPVHLIDMQAHVAAGAIRPWDKLDVLAFAGMSEHVSEHLKVLIGNPVTNAEGKVFVQDFHNIVAAAQPLIQQIEEAEGESQQTMTAKEQADIQLRWAELELKAKKQGVDLEEKASLKESRDSRFALSARQQRVKEINEDRRLSIEKERVRVQEEQMKKQANERGA